MPKDQRRHIVQRVHKRANYDREVIHAIVDEAMICHVSIVDNGQPVVIPTIHARLDDQILLHGLKGGRLLNYVEAGGDVCVAFTLLDGLVLARSAFHHSMNYRSAVIFGNGEEIVEPVAKMRAMKRFVDHLTPDRWGAIREPNDKEIKQTSIVAINIEDASAKIRKGPPVDDDVDYELPIWAGLIPLDIKASAAVPDDKLKHDLDVPSHVEGFQPHLRHR